MNQLRNVSSVCEANLILLVCRIMERDGAKVVLDATSLDLVQGSKLDYVEELIGSSFQVVENPNADTGCGCGNSFNIKI